MHLASRVSIFPAKAFPDLGFFPSFLQEIFRSFPYLLSENMDKVSTPPGFVSQTSFVLKQVSRREGRSNLSRSGRRADKESFESCLWSRPWILHDQATHSSEPPKHELFPFECVERLGASQWYIDVDGVDPTCPRMCKKRIKPNLFITHANVMKQIGVTSQGIRSILQIEGEEEHIFFNLHEKQSSHPVIQSWMQHLKMNPTSICFENIRELDVDGRAFVKSAERKKKEKGKKREEEEKEERIEGEEEKGKEKGKKVFFERILKKTIDASEKRIIANVERILKRAGVTVEALEWSEIRSNKEDDISTGLFAPMRKMKKKKGGKEHVRVIEVGGSTGTTSAGN
ncbi:PREDICTED: uncharacterized protein LOC104825259 isoform X3 [Tarenaya hassleriana]|uniref:uncharacterized protein LOC104825259 isoform X3 n=1 Tax=Tarenaya hassleriana TaxID=28532 RepID=UPI00053C1C00|nr:PREDICTED: uncharacterized protein LOC104825259 isoform X3 [Tarenaya hassleriana]